MHQQLAPATPGALAVGQWLAIGLDPCPGREIGTWTLWLWCWGVGGLGLVVDGLLQLGPPLSFTAWSAYSLWYWAGYWLFCAWLPRLAGVPRARLAKPAMAAITLGLLPAPIDSLFYGLYRTSNGYLSQFDPLLFNAGPGGVVEPGSVTLGAGLCLWLVCSACAVWTWRVTRSWRRTTVALAAAYGCAILLAWPPVVLGDLLWRWVFAQGGSEGSALPLVLVLLALAGALAAGAWPGRPRAEQLAALLLLPTLCLLGGTLLGTLAAGHLVMAALIGLVALSLASASMAPGTSAAPGAAAEVRTLAPLGAAGLVIGVAAMFQPAAVMLGIVALGLVAQRALQSQREGAVELAAAVTAGLAVACGLVFGAPRGQLATLRDGVLPAAIFGVVGLRLALAWLPRRWREWAMLALAACAAVALALLPPLATAAGRS